MFSSLQACCVSFAAQNLLSTRNDTNQSTQKVSILCGFSHTELICRAICYTSFGARVERGDGKE